MQVAGNYTKRAGRQNWHHQLRSEHLIEQKQPSVLNIGKHSRGTWSECFPFDLGGHGESPRGPGKTGARATRAKAGDLLPSLWKAAHAICQGRKCSRGAIIKKPAIAGRLKCSVPHRLSPVGWNGFRFKAFYLTEYSIQTAACSHYSVYLKNVVFSASEKSLDFLTMPSTSSMCSSRRIPLTEVAPLAMEASSSAFGMVDTCVQHR